MPIIPKKLHTKYGLNATKDKSLEEIRWLIDSKAINSSELCERSEVSRVS